jgi:uncharacterized protein (TIGR03435 family)
LIGLVMTVPARSQAPDSFDVASVKPAQPGTRGYSVQFLPASLKASNSTLKTLIAEAYHVYDFQISGGPNWLNSERYDLEGKRAGDGQPTEAQLRTMLQNLLADRFHLALHRDTKDLPVYSIEVAKGGPKFQKSSDPQGEPYFRLFQRRQITAQRAPVAWLAETLSPLLGRPVLEKTGLAGVYDYKLEWTPDAFQATGGENGAPADENVPSLTSALQEQLGLNLRAQKGPVEILVIDRAEKATAN